MPVLFLKGPYEGIEYDTEAKKLCVLDSLSQLSGDCRDDHERYMLTMAFDIVSHIRLVTYE